MLCLGVVFKNCSEQLHIPFSRKPEIIMWVSEKAIRIFSMKNCSLRKETPVQVLSRELAKFFTTACFAEYLWAITFNFNWLIAKQCLTSFPHPSFQFFMWHERLLSFQIYWVRLIILKSKECDNQNQFYKLKCL